MPPSGTSSSGRTTPTGGRWGRSTEEYLDVETTAEKASWQLAAADDRWSADVDPDA